MITVFKKVSGALLLLCLLTMHGAAQQQVEGYLESAEPMMGELQSNVRAFLDEVKPLREKKDVVGLKAVADRYITVWDGMLERLAAVVPPEPAVTHYEALKSLVELQRESNQVMSDTLGQQIVLLTRIEEMRGEGAGDEQVKAFIAENPMDREALIKKSGEIKSATQQADETLKSEHAKLKEMVEGAQGQEG